MNRLLLALKSRTVWTGIILVAINGVPAIKSLIPVQYAALVDAILGLLAIIFHINPRQDFMAQ